jgi:hypothetical protein
MNRRAPMLPRRVTRFPLSRRTGEGWGEGIGHSVSPCETHRFRLLTFQCPFCVPESCGRNRLGRKSGFGNYSVHAVWPDINSAGSIMKGLTIWTSIAWKQNLPSNWTVPATAFHHNEITMREEMPFSPSEAFWSNAFGIIKWDVEVIAKISGRFCKLVFRILRMRHCLGIGARQTSWHQKSLHPNPLPSDGRGDTDHALMLGLTAGLFDRFARRTI